MQNSSKLTWRQINVPSSNSWHFTSHKVLDTIQMVFLVCLHTRIWKRRSFTIFGPSKIIKLLIELWSASVSHLEKWAKLHMHFLEDITLLKLLVVLKVWRLSRTLRTGLVHGLLKDRECTMVERLCRNQEKTHHTQPLLILDHLNSQFLQMCLKKLETNGLKLFQTSIAPPIKHSAMLRRAARMLHQRWSQLGSKWVTTFSKLTQNNICINHPTKNAISLSINADSQERIKTSF